MSLRILMRVILRFVVVLIVRSSNIAGGFNLKCEKCPNCGADTKVLIEGWSQLVVKCKKCSWRSYR